MLGRVAGLAGPISTFPAKYIVVSGLSLYLDASVSRSYPGTGTSWTDLTNSAATATLVNGPTYSAAQGGSIVLDGTNDFISIPNLSSYAPGTGDFAADWWMYGGTSGSFPRVFSIGTYSGGPTLATSLEAGTLYYWAGTTGGTPGSSLGSHGTIANVWSHFAVSRVSGVVRGYKNGTYLNTASNNTNNAVFSAGNYFALGCETTNGTSGGSNTFLGGRLAVFRLYIGKGLSQNEVTQNFNAQRSRYGV